MVDSHDVFEDGSSKKTGVLYSEFGEILKADVTLSLSSTTLYYGNSVVGVGISGLGSRINWTPIISGTALVNGKANEPLNVGKNQEVTILFTPLDTENYNTVEQVFYLDVLPITLTLEGAITISNKQYDGKIAIPDTLVQLPNIQGVLDTDNVTLSCASATTKTKTAGAQSANVILRLTGDDAQNYTLTDTIFTADIYIEPISLTASAPEFSTTTKTYDGTTATPELTKEPTLCGVVETDDVSLVYTCAYDSATVGNRTITVSYSTVGLDVSNYLPPEDYVIDGMIEAAAIPDISPEEEEEEETPEEIPDTSTEEEEEEIPDTSTEEEGEEIPEENPDTSTEEEEEEEIPEEIPDTSTEEEEEETPDLPTEEEEEEPIVALADSLVVDNVNVSYIDNCTKIEGAVSFNIVKGELVSYTTYSSGATVDFYDLEVADGEGSISFETSEKSGEGTIFLLGENEEIVAVDFAWESEVESDVLGVKFGNVLFVNNASIRYVSYQWLYENEEIEGATSQYYKVPDNQNGAYSVVIKTAEGNEIKTCQYNYSASENKNLATVNIYPNPVKENQAVHVVIGDCDSEKTLSEGKIAVYNGLGQRVVEMTGLEEDNRFSLSKGMHVVEVLVGEVRKAVIVEVK